MGSNAPSGTIGKGGTLPLAARVTTGKAGGGSVHIAPALAAGSGSVADKEIRLLIGKTTRYSVAPTTEHKFAKFLLDNGHLFG